MSLFCSRLVTRCTPTKICFKPLQKNNPQFHSTPKQNFDIATLMKVFGKIPKSNRDLRVEKESRRPKIQDHSKVSEETIKERIRAIVDDIKHPLKFVNLGVKEVLKDRNKNGSVLDRYCYQFGVESTDANTRTRIAQILSRTLKKDLRLTTNEEYIAEKRHTLTRLLASHQYHGIFPALMQPFTPSINLCIQFDHPEYGETIVFRGNTLSPTITSTEPKVIFTGRTDVETFYTLVMTDLDYPSLFDPSGRSLVHWIVGNIPSTGIVDEADKIVPFLPPIPAVGTKIHRIAFVLFQQNHGKSHINTTTQIDSIDNRQKFNVEQFAEANHLLPVGLSFFQTKWDPEVSNTYANLGLTEPQYVEESRLERLERRFVVPQRNTYNFKALLPPEELKPKK